MASMEEWADRIADAVLRITDQMVEAGAQVIREDLGRCTNDEFVDRLNHTDHRRSLAKRVFEAMIEERDRAANGSVSNS
jgi:hypothetical protein